MNIEWFSKSKELTEGVEHEYIKMFQLMIFKLVPKTLPMSHSMALNDIIRGYDIPKVSHVAIYTRSNGHIIYGIRGEWEQGKGDLYFHEFADRVTPLGFNKYWED